MKIRTCLFSALLGLLAAAAPAAAQTVSYQGQLRNAGNAYTGLADLQFRLYDQLSGGSQIGTAVLRSNWPIEEGLFNVELDFSAGAFDGSARWLEVTVDGTPLSPRQPITAAPVAAFALAGNEGPQGPEGASPFVLEDNGISFTFVAADNKFEVKDSPALVGPSIVIGSVFNEVDDASVVAGGGSSVGPNVALGGSPGFATVSGGEGNRAEGFASIVAGGRENTASGELGAVGGGWDNTASGEYSVVGGGWSNTASGYASTVAGGIRNCAGGAVSWAGGRNAKVRPGTNSGDASIACAGVPVSGSAGDQATFVWADTENADFISSGSDQFLVRAGGGVGINTNAPTSELHVRGASPDTVFSGQLRIEGDETFGGAETGGAISFQGHDGDIPRVWGVIRSVKENSTAKNTDSVMRFYTRSLEDGLRETMRISSNGIVYNTTGSWAVFSDERLKEDIRPLEGALDRLLSLEGVTFRYRDPGAALKAEGVRTGFVAQQVETVFPEWVGENADGIKYVSPSGFEALTVEALRELAERQEATVEALREQVEDQQQRLARLEMQLRAMASGAATDDSANNDAAARLAALGGKQ